jgi:hypothetical protein
MHLSIRTGSASRALALCAAIAALLLVMSPGPAHASTSLESWFSDDPGLLTAPLQTLQNLRNLGVDRVRVSVRWVNVAPSPNSYTAPHGFNAANPAAYPRNAWTPFDKIAQAAKQTGVTLDFNVLGGAPLWATGPIPPKGGRYYSWEPNPAAYQQFVQAVGTRYSGSYNASSKSLQPGNSHDIPRVSFWTVWNEPDYGPSLSPQGNPVCTRVTTVHGKAFCSSQSAYSAANLAIEHAPAMYRGLVAAAWNGLHKTGHGSDMFVIGEVTPRGQPNPQTPHGIWGLFNGMTPLNFVRNLYCLNSSYRPLTGQAAAVRGCPTNAAGSAAFRSQNPGLFQAKGFSVHPYSRYYAPNVELHNDPNYASLADIKNLENALDKSNSAYRSSTKFSIWSTEYGYITSPPKPHYDPYDHPPGYYVYQTQAAEYINWAEYISYKDPRIASYDQYLLFDPQAAIKLYNFGGYASGLINYNGTKKLSYYAYVMPFFMPQTTTSSGGSLEVWGGARPARWAMLDAPSDAEAAFVQFQPHSTGPWSNFATVPINNAKGYFDTHLTFPTSGSVRIVWQYPTNDLRLTLGGQYAVSRTVQVTVH